MPTLHENVFVFSREESKVKWKGRESGEDRIINETETARWPDYTRAKLLYGIDGK